jgi:ATP-dependent Clp protease adapter protein ClpS
MFEAHTSGCAEVIVCPREPAEYYRERLERFTLTCTIEPV